MPKILPMRRITKTGAGMFGRSGLVFGRSPPAVNAAGRACPAHEGRRRPSRTFRVWRPRSGLRADQREHGALRIDALHDPRAAWDLHRTVDHLAAAGFYPAGRIVDSGDV